MTEWHEPDADRYGCRSTRQILDALDRRRVASASSEPTCPGDRPAVPRDSAALDLTDVDLSGSRSSRVRWFSTCRLQGALLDWSTLDDDYWQATISAIQALWAGGDTWTAARDRSGSMILNEANFANARFDRIDLSDITFPSGELTGAEFSHV